MSAIAEYLTGKLTELLEQRRVVTWYDPRAEFTDYIEALGAPASAATAAPGVTRVAIAGRNAYLAIFGGSFFGLKLAVEPVFGVDNSEPLLLYLPGVERSARDSVLMEIETAGEVFEPQFKRVVRHVLKPLMSDGDIDEILDRPTLTYADVVSLLGQGGAGSTLSILKVVLPNLPDSAALVAAWLASEACDHALTEKQGEAELFRLIRARLGLALDDGTPLAAAREKTARYTLVNEFRGDLQGAAAPESVSLIAQAANADQRAFCSKVAHALRERHATAYAALADRVEHELGLATDCLWSDQLGGIDTFRFEERALLTWGGQLISQRAYGHALPVVTERARCFWVRHDVARQAQWEACRLMAELGRKTKSVSETLSRMPDDPTA